MSCAIKYFLSNLVWKHFVNNQAILDVIIKNHLQEFTKWLGKKREYSQFTNHWKHCTSDQNSFTSENKPLKKSWKQSIDLPKKIEKFSILSKKFWKLALNKPTKIETNMKKLDK